MTRFGTNKSSIHTFPTTHPTTQSRDNLEPSDPWYGLHGKTEIDFTKQTPLHDFVSCVLRVLRQVPTKLMGPQKKTSGRLPLPEV